MNDDARLPEDDRDLDLARRLGAALDSSEPLDVVRKDTQDPLLDILLDYRQKNAGTGLPVQASERMWAAIEANLDHVREAEDRNSVLSLRNTLRLIPTWTYAAAAILLAAAIAWMLFVSVSKPAIVAVAGSEIVTYEAEDGSKITLRPHSTLYLTQHNRDVMKFRLDGEGFFDVVPNSDRTFMVQAGQSIVSVLGTRFNVSTWGERISVFLEEGIVRLDFLPGDQSVILEPGQRVVIGETGMLESSTSAPAGEDLDWLRGELQFEQQPLQQVLAELSHHYGWEIEAADTLLEQTLTGRIKLDDPETSLEDLGIVLGGRFEKISENTYRFVVE